MMLQREDLQPGDLCLFRSKQGFGVTNTNIFCSDITRSDIKSTQSNSLLCVFLGSKKVDKFGFEYWFYTSEFGLVKRTVLSAPVEVICRV